MRRATGWMVLAALSMALHPGQREVARPNWQWWANPAIAEDIGLTAAQVEAIERAQGESRSRRGTIGRQLRNRRTRMGELLAGRDVDRAELAQVVGDIFRLQRAQLRSVVHLRLRVRRVLTPAQLDRLLTRHPGIMEVPWEGPAEHRAGELRPSGGDARN